MSRKIASHLKLHTEENDRAGGDSPLTRQSLDLSSVLTSFSRATGWIARPIGATPHADATEGHKLPLRKRMKLVSAEPIDGALDATDQLGHVTSEQEAWELLEHLDNLVQQLRVAEDAIMLQETQLAASVGVTIRKDEAELLTSRLMETLCRAAEQTASDAAAIYLLDDATSQLKMRCCHGLPNRALAAPARELRGAMADLEALMGNAVLIENTRLAPEWNCPEDFAAGLCLPIGSPTMPQGTMWLWSSHVRDFSSNDIEIAKSASEKVLVDIERCVLADEVLRTRSVNREIEAASMVQSSRLPPLQTLHADYEVGGWTFQGEALGGNFHNWTINKHEQICAAMGSATSSGPAGALVATSVQTVVETCWNSRLKPSQILRKANDILWDVEDGDWRSSLCYLQIMPQSGAVQLSHCGDIQVFVVSSRGVRMVRNTPTYLAEAPDTTFQNQAINLEGGELLVAASADVVAGIERGGFSQDALLEIVQQMQEDSVEDIADHLARMLPMSAVEENDDNRVARTDRSLMIIRRRF